MRAKEADVAASGIPVINNEAEQPGGERDSAFSMKSLLWHGGSAWDAWFSCASNQLLWGDAGGGFAGGADAVVAAVLVLAAGDAGVILQLFYGFLGSWTAYLISVLYIEYRTRKKQRNVNFKNHVIQWFEVLDGLLGPYWKAAGLVFNCTFLLLGFIIQLIACASNIYYINDRLDKRTWTDIFGACCATTVFVPSFRNYRIWSFLGLGMTTYTAVVHGQCESSIPQWFQSYLLETPYAVTLMLPSAAAVYWAFGDQLLSHSNVFSRWRDAAVVLMLIHQFITCGFACTPLYFVWEKVVGMHDSKSICRRAIARLPIWFLSIIFPFFGPINSAVGSLLVSFTVCIIPALAHMLTYRAPSARQNAAEKPPFFFPSRTAMYAVNAFVVGVGAHDQLHRAGEHLWALRQVLPVPQAPATRHNSSHQPTFQNQQLV
ncbi:hypothetical protein C4D60_Mb10t24550 [Musa balbisiana]|uniref:Amino acid transporter transmembrane domain-containing protein n=1 Tax=Musa balbisiana TaxID=52838 RepID=A0A4S8IZG0_MUSBA|nr:hypothetical protein C4D60_Mb10t24550 [Musa balbisiana]